MKQPKYIVPAGVELTMGEAPRKSRRKLTISSEFFPYINDVVIRFSYLHPSVEIEAGTEVTMLIDADAGANVADLVRDFQFALYRQKIFTETLPLRKALIEGVMGR